MANQYRTITPKGIESIFQTLCESDSRIKVFRLGDFAQGETSNADGYPLVMFELIESRIAVRNSMKYTEWEVRFYCFTMRRNDWSNVVDAFAETHTILSDLMLRTLSEQQFKTWGFSFDPNQKIQFDYITREDRDDLIGTSCDLKFSTPLMLCSTDFPVDALPDAGLAYSGGSGVATSYLTCSTLAACSVIQSIQTDIASISGSTGSFACADLLACASFTNLSAQTQSNSADIIALSAQTDNITYITPGENLYTGGTPGHQIVGLNGTIYLTGATAISNNTNTAIVGSNLDYGYGVQGNGKDQPGVFSYSYSGLGFFVNTDAMDDTVDLAWFYNFELAGLKIKNNGGLQWTTLTGAATTRTNLGLGNVLSDIIALSATTTLPDHSVPYATGGTFASDVNRFAYYPADEALYAKIFSARTGTFTSSVNVLGPISINGTSITDLFAPISRSIQPGENAYTAGTINSHVVGVVGSPVFTAVTATNISATTFTEGGTTLANKYEPRYATINRTSGTYILVLADDSKAVWMSGGTAQNLVVPRNAAVAFPIGTQVGVIQSGAGQVSFSADTGVTLQSYQSHVKIAGQYAGASLLKTDTNEWSLIGNLSA